MIGRRSELINVTVCQLVDNTSDGYISEMSGELRLRLLGTLVGDLLFRLPKFELPISSASEFRLVSVVVECHMA